MPSRRRRCRSTSTRASRRDTCICVIPSRLPSCTWVSSQKYRRYNQLPVCRPDPMHGLAEAGQFLQPFKGNIRTRQNLRRRQPATLGRTGIERVRVEAARSIDGLPHVVRSAPRCSASSATVGFRPKACASSGSAWKRRERRSWMCRGGRTIQLRSRKYRFSSPVMVGAAYAGKLSPLVRSKPRAAFTRPR